MGFSEQDRLGQVACLGVCGGLTAALVGHPFDTIKTRLQMVRTTRLY